jgi:hypothetical protein
VPLSRSPGFLAVIHRRAETHCSIPFTACFPDFHAFTRLPCSSDDYGLPFHALVHASWSPWGSGCLVRPVPPASPTSKLHSLLRVRSQLAWVSPHQLADTLLGFCPSRAFSSHASDSRPAQTWV